LGQASEDIKLEIRRLREIVNTLLAEIGLTIFNTGTTGRRLCPFGLFEVMEEEAQPNLTKIGLVPDRHLPRAIRAGRAAANARLAPLTATRRSRGIVNSPRKNSENTLDRPLPSRRPLLPGQA
jgi:hypothetical protein